MRIEIQGYVLEIDFTKTKEYYNNIGLNDCSCLGCQNFQKNMETLNTEIKEFFLKIGINNLNQSVEIIPYYTEKNGKVFYQSIYHVCGEILKKPNMDKELSLIKGFSIWISEKCDLLDSDFPSPSFQITLETSLPWIMNEINPY